jgi:hypothetical protein
VRSCHGLVRVACRGGRLGVRHEGDCVRRAEQAAGVPRLEMESGTRLSEVSEFVSAKM